MLKQLVTYININKCLLPNNYYLRKTFIKWTGNQYVINKSIINGLCAPLLMRFSSANNTASESVVNNGSKVILKREIVKSKTYVGLGILLLGASLASYGFYELFINVKPEDLITQCLNRCRLDGRVQKAIGIPVKYFGIGYSNVRDSLGSRKPYLEFEERGKHYISIKLYHRGSKKRGTLFVEYEKNTENIRYLYFEVVGNEKNIIVLEDNRNIVPVQV